MTRLVVLTIVAAPAVSQDQIPSKEAVGSKMAAQEVSPYVGRNYPALALFGDTLRDSTGTNTCINGEFVVC